MSTVLNTGADLNLVNEAWITQTWLDKEVKTSLLCLRAAGNEPMRVEKVIPLDVQLGDLRVIVWIGVVTILAVEVLLGTSFIDRFVTMILPLKQQNRAHQAGARSGQ